MAFKRVIIRRVGPLSWLLDFIREILVASENNPEDVDGPLSSEALLAVAALSPDDIQAIDVALIDNVGRHWRKVAFVVGVAMTEHPNRFPGIPDVFYAERVKVLVSQGILESQGNLSRMRYSEIRSPATVDIANEI